MEEKLNVRARVWVSGVLASRATEHYGRVSTHSENDAERLLVH
jgi:hypothetical protein